jgi:hypothetical protein
MATPGCWRCSGWSSREPTAPASVDLAKQFRGDRHVSGRQKTRFQERFLARLGDCHGGAGDGGTFADPAFGAQYAPRAGHATLAVVAYNYARQHPRRVKTRWGPSDHAGARARSFRYAGTNDRRRIGVTTGPGGKDRSADQGKVDGRVGRSSSARHARPCAGHPRLYCLKSRKTWMAGTSPAMTKKRNA